MTIFGSIIESKEKLPDQLVNVGVTERVGEKIPSGLLFYDEQGKKVVLSDYLKSGVPLIINFVYFNCPMLCNLLLDGLSDGLKQLKTHPGDSYQVITISFDPADTPDLALKFKKKYLEKTGLSSDNKGWHFWVAPESSIRSITKALGFRYKYDEDISEYAHSAMLAFITSDGVISRYLYGIQYPKNDLKLAILGARKKETLSAIEQGLLFCYNYDPSRRTYTIHIMNLMKVLSAITVFAMGVILFKLKKQEGKFNTND